MKESSRKSTPGLRCGSGASSGAVDNVPTNFIQRRGLLQGNEGNKVGEWGDSGAPKCQV